MRFTGFLPLNKPAGVRSTHCVEAVRKIFGGKVRVGHGGTLDSTASGLLVILLGQCTRLSNFVMDMPKRYKTLVRLGSVTDTDDASGALLSQSEWRHITESDIDTALCGFMGWRMQEPPQISAVHVCGKRAHSLARMGLEVKVEAKPVYFASVTRTGPISQDGEVPFTVCCRKGTYIRGFARDLGRVLGCGAHVRELVRESVGTFDLALCAQAPEFSGACREELARRVLPPDFLRGAVLTYHASESDAKSLSNGRPVLLSELERLYFGRFITSAGSIIVVSDGIFSLCARSFAGSTLRAEPEVNIIDSGSD